MDATDRAIRVITGYTKAWRDGDFEALCGWYAEDFTLHYFGNNRFSGDHVGKQACIDVLVATAQAAPRRLIEVEQVLPGPGAAVLVVCEEIETSSGPVQVRRVLRYRVAAGRLAECWLYEEHQGVIDQAWS